ncbi:radical SAM protein [Ruminiclostridium herbifermentans]|uniref:Radical SAM protein n=1 Tax=Ruminiclostridium herbifermentans TaxID=2488810 RepID=A0A4U7JIA2_9FIRM|nr:radical SAM protein [Ruminiclostridium herbifermentans]QNU67063.1 radical SAM protein [Ruminiclostridium herbifermentans]
MPLFDYERESISHIDKNEVLPDMYSTNTSEYFIDFEQSMDQLGRLEEMGLFMEYFIAPTFLIWEITSNCPLRCSFCSGDFPNENGDELTSEEKISLAQELIDAKIWGINLSGGEPLLSQDLLTLVNMFSDNGVAVNIVTSGWGMTKEIAKVLSEKNMVGVVFSLDAPREEIHDELRGRKGAFKEALNAIHLLREAGMAYISVESVITQKNIDYIDEMVEFCRDNGISQIRFQPVVLIGRGNERNDLGLSKEQLELLAAKVKDIRNVIFTEIINNVDKPKIQVNLIDQSTHIIYGIKTGRNIGGIIKYDGTLKISAYLHYTFGNIRNSNGFMNIWRNGYNVGWRHPELISTLSSVRNIKDIELAAKNMNYKAKSLDVQIVKPK